MSGNIFHLDIQTALLQLLELQHACYSASYWPYVYISPKHSEVCHASKHPHDIQVHDYTQQNWFCQAFPNFSTASGVEGGLSMGHGLDLKPTDNGSTIHLHHDLLQSS